MTQKNAYTIGQAATYLGISPDTLRRWETKGKIKPSRTPGGQRLFSEDQLLTIKKLYFEKAPQEFLAAKPAVKTSLRHFLLGLFILSLTFSLAFNAFTSEITKQISQTLTKYITKPPEGEVAGQETKPQEPLLLSSRSENLLINSSFEGGNLNSQPKSWGYLASSHVGNTYVSNQSVRTGTQALKLSDTGCSLSACQLGLSQPVSQTINGRTYILSLFIRTKGIKGNPKIRMGFFGTASSSDPNYGSSGWSSYSADKYQDYEIASLQSNNDWFPLSFTYENAALSKYPLIEVLDYQGGEIYLDDVSMVEITSPLSSTSSLTNNQLLITN
ncbi:MerR family transcriptional regulator, partial [Candidatus Gottesmanbacteria bacterium]|nr:MerR family transcriptional regulator [Candidatus Gottesmanbacteria bacterium]